MVSPRFAPGVSGGAENLVRGLATHAPAGWDVEIATTCAHDHHTWFNALPPGRAVDDGLVVHRFPVSPRDAWEHERIAAHLAAAGAVPPGQELRLMGTSVWSAGLQEFLDARGRDYDLILFAPYLFGTTFWGAQAWPGRSVLIPCLHDEPHAHMACMGALFGAVAGCVFNAPAEERLARRLFPVASGGVVGMGIDPVDGRPAAPPPAAVAALPGPYLVYVGRQEEGQRVDVAVEYTARLARERHPGLHLVLIGSGTYAVPPAARPYATQLGFVDDDTKRAVIAGAAALVNPSELESFSIVLMEAWREGVPAVVSAGSDVMAEHCALSGGGVAFADYAGFADAVSAILDDPGGAARMGEAGRAYVAREWSWPAVTERFRTTIESIYDHAQRGHAADAEDARDRSRA